MTNAIIATLSLFLIIFFSYLYLVIILITALGILIKD